jgi:hypothetical protein
MTQSKTAASKRHDLRITRKQIYCYKDIVIEKMKEKSRSFLADSMYPVESIGEERHAAQS